jgi:8-oxo-dGTP pyrophosphatase MutT (NUDIX family)
MSSRKPRSKRRKSAAPAGERDAKTEDESKGQGTSAEKGRTGGKRKGRARSRKTAARERSAGGVVVRDGQVVVIVPTRLASDGSKVLALPKGHIDPGETALQAAVREVREETGIVGEPVTELGETRYWYRRDGQTIPKSVSFYLFRYVEGDPADHDDEVEEARWIAFEDADRELSHSAEREMVARAAQYLEDQRKDR